MGAKGQRRLSGRRDREPRCRSAFSDKSKQGKVR